MKSICTTTDIASLLIDIAADLMVIFYIFLVLGSKKNKEYEVIFKNIQDSFRELYRGEEEYYQNDDDCPYPCSKTFDQLYVELQIIEDDKTDRKHPIYKGKQNVAEEEATIYGLCKNYRKEHGKTLNRVLCLGEAGKGKTTLCRRIALDFSKGTDEFKETFEDRELVIFLRCRELGDDLATYLTEVILNKLSVDENEIKFVMDCLDRNASKIIFLVDGLDELEERRNSYRQVDRLLKQKILKNSLVIATTRNEGVKGRHSCFNFAAYIKGFTCNQVEKFVSRYFQTEVLEESETYIQSFLQELRSNKRLEALSETLLCLLNLCFIWLDNYSLPGTTAELYHIILKTVLDRFCYRNDRLKWTRLAIKTMLCKLAYISLQKGDTYFTNDDLNQAIKDLDLQGRDEVTHFNDAMVRNGLVVYEKPRRKHDPHGFEFFHKSYQEYLACLHVSETFCKASTDEEKADLCRNFSWLVKIEANSDTTVKFCHSFIVSCLIGILDTVNFLWMFSEIFEKLEVLNVIWDTTKIIKFVLNNIQCKNQADKELQHLNDKTICDLLSNCLPRHFNSLDWRDWKPEYKDIIQTSRIESVNVEEEDMTNPVLETVMTIKTIKRIEFR